MVNNVPALPVFAGGQMTDLPVFNGTVLTGTELFEIVSPGDPQTSLNYSITSALLANLITNLSTQIVIINNGQHTSPGDPYIVGPTVGRVYVNKNVAEMTYVQLGLASVKVSDVLVADIGGQVTGVDFIQVTFSAGETADNLSPAEVPISTPYGGYFFRPIPLLNTWHLGTG